MFGSRENEIEKGIVLAVVWSLGGGVCHVESVDSTEGLKC